MVAAGTSFKIVIINESDCEAVARLHNALSVLHALFENFAPVSITLVRGNPAGPNVSPSLSRSYNHYNAAKVVGACSGTPGVLGMVVEDDLMCSDLPQGRLLLLQAARTIQLAGQVVSLCASSPWCAYMISPMYAAALAPANAADMSGAITPPPGPRSLYPAILNGSTAGIFNGVINPLGRLNLPLSTNPGNPRLALPAVVALLAQQRWADAASLVNSVIVALQRYSAFHVRDRIVGLLFLLRNSLQKKT